LFWEQLLFHFNTFRWTHGLSQIGCNRNRLRQPS
jgi:hypothetical protein